MKCSLANLIGHMILDPDLYNRDNVFIQAYMELKYKHYVPVWKVEEAKKHIKRKKEREAILRLSRG